jgi:long-chain fatty acid transport protein
MKKRLAILGVAALLCGAAAPAGATNGMDMVGYNTRAIGMGGADVAVDSDASAVGGNPALISTAAPSSATIQLTALMPQLNYSDPANDVDGEDQIFAMPMLGYVHKMAGSPWSVGLGVYAQGGMGVNFKNVRTPAGNQDEMTSTVSFLRVNPIVAYQVNDALNLGATLMVGYAQAQFTLFPSTPGNGSGLNVQDLASFGYAGRIGAQYKVSPKVRVGATYTTASSIDLDDGTAVLNFGPMGYVKYDAQLEDFSWPQEAEFGVAYTPAPGLTLAADVKWINWSATIDTPKLKVSNPPAGFPDSPFPGGAAEFDMGWDDQWVFAFGAEYAINAKHTVRAGFNYANNPVPDDKLNPLFPAIPTTHASLGYGLNLGKWLFDLAYEHAFEETQKSSVSPFEISHSQNTVSLAATYRY